MNTNSQNQITESQTFRYTDYRGDGVSAGDVIRHEKQIWTVESAAMLTGINEDNDDFDSVYTITAHVRTDAEWIAQYMAAPADLIGSLIKTFERQLATPALRANDSAKLGSCHAGGIHYGLYVGPNGEAIMDALRSWDSYADYRIIPVAEMTDIRRRSFEALAAGVR